MQLCNQCLEQNGHAERVGHRSYERQEIDQIPTVHLGVSASAMEKRGDLNREIEVTNQKLRQLKARISKLQKWLKEESENTEPSTLADYIQGVLLRKAQTGKPGYSHSLCNLKDAAKDYLKGVMNGKTTIPTKTWKTEHNKLTAERKRLISGILH